MTEEHDLFDRELLGNFQAEYTDDGDIVDWVSDKTLRNPGPEEIVRQWYERVLVKKYNYDKGQIEIEVPIKMGSKTKHADLVVYESRKKKNIKIIVETKKPERSDGVDQLQSYMEAKGVEIGVWTNGREIDFFYRPGKQEFQPISDIPSVGECISAIRHEITQADLEAARDLIPMFEWCEDQILAHQGGLDVFDELFKIIFTKLYDEIENLHTPSSKAKFRAGPTEDPDRVRQRITRLFEGDEDSELGAKRKWKDVFEDREHIELNAKSLKLVVGRLQSIHLMETDMDVLGAGFEVLVPDQMKDTKGQYFTPRQVVSLATKLANPSRPDDVLDPACGSGGFLVYVMRNLFQRLLEKVGEENRNKAFQLVSEYASNHTFGTDYDQRLVRVAKAYMVIWGDGRSNVYHVPDALRYFDWNGDVKARIPENHFDVILTNPPFAGDLNIVNDWKHFDLGVRRGEQLETQRKDILFLERCIKHLKPGGRMAIVLPKGDLDEKEKKYVRDYIKRHTYIRAVVGLHPYTFLPYAGDVTNVLLLEKKRDPGPADEDYSIYMAVSERAGKNNEGEPVYLRDENGEYIRDVDGKLQLDTDLYEIADEYHNDEEPEIGYYVSRSDLEDRINARYYHPKYEEVEKQLSKAEASFPLKGLLDDGDERSLINGIGISNLSDTGKREYVKDGEGGIPYLRAGDVYENKIDLEDCKRVPYSLEQVKKNRHLEVGDLLVSRKGTYGRVSAVTERETETIISSEIMKIRLKDEIELENGELREIDPFYVSAYLNSEIAQLQFDRRITGGISQGINQTGLKKLRVPLPPIEVQKSVGDKYREARELRQEIKRKNEDALQQCESVHLSN